MPEQAIARSRRPGAPAPRRTVAPRPFPETVIQAAMRQQLKGIDLSRTDALVPAEVARAIRSLRVEISRALMHHDFIKGWTQAYSLDERHAAKTADFLLYAALTTVARRPGSDVSWTQNWP